MTTLNNNTWTTQAPVVPGWFLVKEQRSTGRRYTAVRITKKPFQSQLYIGTEGYIPPQPFTPVANGDEWFMLEKHYPFYWWFGGQHNAHLPPLHETILGADTEAGILAQALRLASAEALNPERADAFYGWLEGKSKEQFCVELGRALKGLGYSIVKAEVK